MTLGFNTHMNNWKIQLGNFLVTFGVQALFKIDEIINQNRFPSELEWAKIATNSIIMTLVFYGYTRLKGNGQEKDGYTRLKGNGQEKEAEG